MPSIAPTASPTANPLPLKSNSAAGVAGGGGFSLVFVGFVVYYWVKAKDNNKGRIYAGN